MSEETAAALTAECENAADLPQTDEKEELSVENERLRREIDRLKKEAEDREERISAHRRLKELVGSESDPLYGRALKKAEEQEELRALPLTKRCELGYLLCLGEDCRRERSEGARPAPPSFARSGGGEAPALPMKKPTDFETARENARKYFGGR